MKLEDIQLWVSPLSGEIYLGTVSKDGRTAKQKRKVTDEVLSVVASYLDENKVEVDFEEGKATLKLVKNSEATV